MLFNNKITRRTLGWRYLIFCGSGVSAYKWRSIKLSQTFRNFHKYFHVILTRINNIAKITCEKIHKDKITPKRE